MPDTMEEVNRQYRKARWMAYIAAVGLVFGIFLLFYEALIGITVIVLAIVLYFAFYRPARRSYGDLVNRINLERTICRIIDSPSPDPAGGDFLTEQMLIDSDLMPETSDEAKPLFCWEMKGHRKAFTISLADTTVLQRYSSGGRKASYSNISGVFLVFELPADTHRYFMAVDKEFMPDYARELFMNTKREYEREPIDDEDLAERCFLYRSYKDSQSDIPIPFLQSVKRLINYTPGQVAITVKGDKMYAFIKRRFLSQSIGLTKPTSQMLDTDQFPELSYIVNIASTLTGGEEKNGQEN